MTRLWQTHRLFRAARGPIHVDLEEGLKSDPRKLTFNESLKLGYGEHCEVRLDGESGPEEVCSLERARGPYRLWVAPGTSGSEGNIEVLVDGHRVTGATQDLQPGACVEIFDRRNERHYRMILEPSTATPVRLRYLAYIVLTLTISGILGAVYFYTSLQSTRSQLAVTEQRLHRAESDVERARGSLQIVEQHLIEAQGEFGAAVHKLRQAQSVSERAIRSEFDLRLAALTEHTQADLARLSEQDNEAREHLRIEARAQVAAIREELEDRMVSTYQEFKRVEERLIRTLGSRLEAMEPTSTRFKRVLQNVRGSILFIRTTYEMEFLRTGQIVSQQSFGSGFLVSENGLAMTARHVMFPWLYENRLQVLVVLGLVKIREDSVRWSMWTHDQQILEGEDESGERIFNTDTGWNSSAEDRALQHLYSPPLHFTEEQVEAPVGSVTISVPVPGSDDVAVVQLMQFTEPVVSRTLTQSAPESLDEALAVGYPLSRLEDGRTVPQGVTGFVRRLTEDMLELNTTLNPGLSGGPIFNRSGDIIGMGIGIFQSEAYGLAVRARDLRRVLEETAVKVRKEEQRLKELGCNPGPVDGVFDALTWSAYGCEKNREK